MVTPVASAIARSRSGRRPRPIGVISTIVPIPLARASRTSSIERSTSVNALAWSAGESRIR